MSYMVMECHRAYAIVLDSEGRFLKVANLGYSVGQKTDFVIESGADENLDDTGAEAGKPGSGRKNRALTFALAAAACLCLVVGAAIGYGAMTGEQDGGGASSAEGDHGGH